MSNALDISKNTARISFGGSQSQFEKIWWFIDGSWFTQQSNGRKPDWLGVSSSFSSIYLKRELNISLSKIFPNIGKSETERLFFMGSFSLFLWIGTTFAFFHRLGKVFLSLQLLNMIERVLLYFYHIVSIFLWIPHSAHGPC